MIRAVLAGLVCSCSAGASGRSPTGLASQQHGVRRFLRPGWSFGRFRCPSNSRTVAGTSTWATRSSPDGASEVTDPKNPKYISSSRGPQGTVTSQIRFKQPDADRSQADEAGASGGNTKATETAVLLWDISDPVNRSRSQAGKWSSGTHRNSYRAANTRISANMPGYRGRTLVALTSAIQEPEKEAGRWWMPGQKEGETAPENLPDFTGRPMSARWEDGHHGLRSCDHQSHQRRGASQVNRAAHVTPPFPDVGSIGAHGAAL